MNTVAYPAVRDPLRPHVAGAAGGRLYVVTAALIAAVAFAGFAQSYWSLVAAGTIAVHPAIHVHAALFSAWPLYFLAQTVLVASGHTAWHREIGLFGIALASLMVFAGVLATIVQLRADLVGPQPDVARGVAALGFSALLLFTTFVALGIGNIRRPEIHRRFMVLASFAILGAATTRLMRLVPETTQPERALLGAVAVDVLLLAVVLLDRRAVGRIHPVWMAGGAILIASQWLRRALSRTDLWTHVTDWLAALG
jgi:energy-converting hydrogenase Eha subunit A